MLRASGNFKLCSSVLWCHQDPLMELLPHYHRNSNNNNNNSNNIFCCLLTLPGYFAIRYLEKPQQITISSAWFDAVWVLSATSMLDLALSSLFPWPAFPRSPMGRCGSECMGPGLHCPCGRCLMLVPIPMRAASVVKGMLCILQHPTHLPQPGRSRCSGGESRSDCYLQPITLLGEVCFFFSGCWIIWERITVFSNVFIIRNYLGPNIGGSFHWLSWVLD